MATTGPFGYEVTEDGLKITANGNPISITLIGVEIDMEIASLKAELDELERRMRVADQERSAKVWRDADNA